VGIAATNYAVEGATGEWSCVVCSKVTYARSLPEQIRIPAMRWLEVHAEYDDTHPRDEASRSGFATLKADPAGSSGASSRE